MDRAFLEYYEEELSHVRDLAREFAALHPNVARNLQIESAPCPDPYVERLLEGVAFLAARTRMKVDAESSRYVRNILEALYPDISAPAPAMSVAQLGPGPQVERMVDGHLVKRGTRLVSRLRDGMQTRCVYTTAQDVRLWPLRVAEAEYLQDAGALAATGVSDERIRHSGQGLRIAIERVGPGTISELSLDSLDIYLNGQGRGGGLFDAIFGCTGPVLARPEVRKAAFSVTDRPQMIGIADDEGLLPRVRAAFEGYRLLREYFLMPERFHFTRLSGLARAVRETGEGQRLEIVILLTAPRGNIAGVSGSDIALHATPVVNLFEQECNLVELGPSRASHLVHADRSRPRDYEIYRLLRVEDADRDGPQARIRPLFSMENRGDSGHVYAVDRRPRRPGEDELRHGQMRTSYAGDDFLISVAQPSDEQAMVPPTIRRLDIRALCTNRDLPILDDTPVLTLETGDPVRDVRLMRPVCRPRPSLRASLPTGVGNEAGMDDLVWRLVGQLSLNYLSLAETQRDAEPLRALLRLYADRGDPTYERHGKAVVGLQSRAVLERLEKAGPLCFGSGTEITLEINEGMLTGGSELLLSVIMAHLFSRHAAINSFVRTRTRLTQSEMEVAWPMTPGTRALI